VFVSDCIQLRAKDEKQRNVKQSILQSVPKIQQKLFMRGGRQHPGWKSDDERRKRAALSPEQASPTSINNNDPGNYTHEKTHIGN
jgi:hypothetical protein